MHFLREWIIIGLSLVLFAGACRQEEQPDSQTASGGEGVYAVSKTFGGGPVKLIVELSEDSLTTAEGLRCRVRLEADSDYEAEFPDLMFSTDVPGLVANDYQDREATRKGKTFLSRTWELEPEYAGTFTIPVMEVYYHRKGEVKEELLESEPLEVQVKETSASAEQLELKPIRGLVTVKEMEARNARIWPRVLGIFGGLAGVGLVGFYWYRRPKKSAPPPPAHEIAMQRLRELVDKKLVENGAVEQFFVEITGIVRDYIEQSYGLRAPEQTTEEFLNNITDHTPVARHRGVLEPFLTAADEVKFARQQPETQTIQRAFDTARDFIVETSKDSGGRS